MHLFRYRLKCLLRNRVLIFWTLLFPIFLGTAFYLSFGQIVTGGSPDPIKAAVVDNAAYRQDVGMQRLLAALSQPGESQLLQLAVASETEAAAQLERGEVAGVIKVGAHGPTLAVKRSGLNQSMLKLVLDEYLQTTATVNSLMQKYPERAPQLLSRIIERASFTKEKSFSGANPDIMLNYFFSLIAMTCLSGSYWGLQNSTHTQANLSAHGMRRAVAPTPKIWIVLTDMAAAVLITFVEVLLLLVYLAGVLHVNFGSQLLFILLVGLIGSLNGVALGTFVGTVSRQSEGVKSAMLIGVTLSLSFFAGLMFVNMKDIVMRKAPLLAQLNPAALITDSFYSLYIFSNNQRFFSNLAILSLLTALFCLGSFFCLRSERYASV